MTAPDYIGYMGRQMAVDPGGAPRPVRPTWVMMSPGSVGGGVSIRAINADGQLDDVHNTPEYGSDVAPTAETSHTLTAPRDSRHARIWRCLNGGTTYDILMRGLPVGDYQIVPPGFAIEWIWDPPNNQWFVNDLGRYDPDARVTEVPVYTQFTPGDTRPPAADVPLGSIIFVSDIGNGGELQVRIDVEGTPVWSFGPVHFPASVDLSADYDALVTATWTVIPFDNIVDDPLGLWDNTNKRWEIPNSGPGSLVTSLEITCNLDAENNDNGDRVVGASITTNGAVPLAGADRIVLDARLVPQRQSFGFTGIPLTFPSIPVTIGDYVQVWIYTTATDLDVIADGATWFACRAEIQI